MVSRTCSGRKPDGSPCTAAPLMGGGFCLWHDPDHQDELTEARRLGGQRRRRERVVAGAYDFEGLGSVPSIRRLVEVAATDTLGLENSVARARALAYLAQVATGLLEKGETEERLAAIESVLGPRMKDRKGGRR